MTDTSAIQKGSKVVVVHEGRGLTYDRPRPFYPTRLLRLYLQIAWLRFDRWTGLVPSHRTYGRD
jgi:hypothetical protein